MTIGWSSIGKIAAGVATIFLSFYFFRYSPGWVKIIILAALVALLVVPPLLMNRKLPADLEKALKDDDKGSKYR